MKKYLTLAASFIIMLCIGSAYAWSIIASELIENFGFSGSQSQIIFGTLTGVFAVTMIFVGKLGEKIKYKYIGYIAGLLFCLGFVTASYSQGNFIFILMGIGVLAGMATAFGYWVALTAPVQWFPKKKGLITGVAAAGFGLGAVLMSILAEKILNDGNNVLELLKIIGIAYGLLILVFSNLIYQAISASEKTEAPARVSDFINSIIFKKLFIGLFLGCFGGLLIIGSLKVLGAQHAISNHNLLVGVGLFSIANFFGRVFWGFVSDHIGANLSIFFALLFQGAAIISLNLFPLSDNSYLVIAVLIGFGFGGNLVLFAKETAQEFGVQKMGTIYPYVFIGYGIAGITGPIAGGYLYDL